MDGEVSRAAQSADKTTSETDDAVGEGLADSGWKKIAEIGVNWRKSEKKAAREGEKLRLEFFAAAQPLDEGGDFGRGRCAEFFVEGVFEVMG